MISEEIRKVLDEEGVTHNHIIRTYKQISDCPHRSDHECSRHIGTETYSYVILHFVVTTWQSYRSILFDDSVKKMGH